MTLSDQLLAALVLYGLPVLFGVILLAAIGVPLPGTLLLVAAGSFVEQGQLSFWWVIALAAAAAVAGDNIGYALGRWGGRRAALRLARWFGGEARLLQAETTARRWGGPGIFLTRWLLAPIGPAVNLTSGFAAYPWPAFLFFDVTGELLWVVLYVMAGQIFSNRVQAMAELLGDLTWLIVGILAVCVRGWMFLQSFRPRSPRQGEPELTTAPSQQ